MSTQQFMMLFRGTNWEKGLSPQEIQNIMKRWVEWNDRLVKEGKVKVAQPLVGEGKVISGKKKRIISDGPFAESKEAIAGYFLLEAKDLDEAVDIAKGCPTLDYGTIVEVRPIAVLNNEKLSPAVRLYLESMAELNED
ncbi:YciI family protein [bacterium]|nr:YciI family protein [bacterium]